MTLHLNNLGQRQTPRFGGVAFGLVFVFGGFMFAIGGAAHAQQTDGPKSNGETGKRDLSGKVVLANIDKHRLGFRIGKVQKEVASKKASILSPKEFPFTFQIWSGNSKLKWTPVTANGPGLYVAQFEKGKWTVTKRTAKPKSNTTAKSSAATSGSRSVGSRTRIAQRGGGTRVTVNPNRFRRPWRGHYWSPVARCVWSYATLYRFIRNEEDREWFRRWVIDGEIDDAIREEIEDRIWESIQDEAVNLPADELDDIERAWDEIRDIDDEDWLEAENLPADEWDRVRDELQGEISDEDWGGLRDDFDNITDTMDITDGDMDAIQEVGLDDLQQDVELQDLDGADLGDLGEIDLDDANADIDLGDITMDAENLDLGDLSDIGGSDWDLGHNLDGPDPGFGGNDGGFGGNLDSGQGPLGDLAAGAPAAGTLDNLGGGSVDGGGWDSYNYGNYGFGGGNDWGGGNLGGGNFGGGGNWGGGGGFGGGDFGGGGLGGGDFGGGGFGGGDFGGGDFGGGGFGGGDFGGGGFGGGDFGGGDFGGDFDF